MCSQTLAVVHPAEPPDVDYARTRRGWTAMAGRLTLPASGSGLEAPSLTGRPRVKPTACYGSGRNAADWTVLWAGLLRGPDLLPCEEPICRWTPHKSRQVRAARLHRSGERRPFHLCRRRASEKVHIEPKHRGRVPPHHSGDFVGRNSVKELCHLAGRMRVCTLDMRKI